MGWASEQFWRNLASVGIYPNVLSREPKEHRCGSCREREACPAYNTEVLYPCPHYEEEIK